ncbi:MAG TPA: hypothetical protein VLK84_00110 [Longimicrobium sp.]|nr:hypothetical protein [Longimicrobium sp.]
MDELMRETVRAEWRRRLWALRTKPDTDYLARTVTDASYFSATGEFVPRVRLPDAGPGPEINQYQFAIDNTPYRLACSSALLAVTCTGGPPVGWQPPVWSIVHEDVPHCHLGFLGKAETPEPTAAVLERAREWIAEKESAP